MNSKRFRDTEVSYNNLKSRLESGEIGPDEMKAQLKKMMVMDDAGIYWMIGSKTGKWYRYDGGEWKTGDPYEEVSIPGQATAAPVPEPEMTSAKGAETIRPAAVPAIPMRSETVALPAPGPEPAEKKADRFDTSTICRFCKSKIDAHAQYCPFCGGNQSEKTRQQPSERMSGELLIRGVNILSLIFFLGGVGLVAGVVCGAAFGVFNILGDLIFQFPIMLRETRGKFQGGLLFAAIGGLGGFLLSAIAALFIGLFYNFLSFVFGGIRLRVKS